MIEKKGTSVTLMPSIILPWEALFVAVGEVFNAHAQLGF